MTVLIDESIKRADGFLSSLGILPEQIEMEAYCQWFLQEMSNGLEGKASSLKMIPTYIEPKQQIPIDSPVIVIDAGGTNLRTCVVTLTQEGPEVSDFSKRGMPGVRHEVSRDEFYGLIADALEPVYSSSDRIGFCFSYAASITPQKDGRLIVFSKEIKAPEVIGTLVGSSLLEKMRERGYEQEKRLCLLNDTVATLLAGMGSGSDHHYDGFIGFILGTGTNTSYVESNGNIKTAQEVSSEGTQVINVESGNFAVNLTEFDRSFISTTKDPNVYHFEKLISGAYLGQYAQHVLEEAVRQKVLSDSFADRFYSSISRLDTITADEYLHRPYGQNPLASCCVDEQDALTVYRILDKVIERAAKLTAVNLAATVIKSGSGRDPRRPVCINADGTTFYMTHNLKRYTEEYLYAYLTQQKGHWYQIVSIDRSPIIGAAIAGLIS